MATSPNLEDMKLPELKELAKQMGLRGTSTMRKPELIATLQAARSGGEAPAGVTVRAPKSAAFTASAAQAATPSADAEVAAGKAEEADKPAEAAAVKADDAENSEKTASKTSGRTRVERTERSERSSRRKQDEAPAGKDAADVMAAVNALDSLDEAPKRRRRRDTEAATDLLAELGLDDASPKQDDRRRHRKDDEVDAEPRRRRRVAEEPKDEDVVRDLDDILATLPSQGNEDDERHGETEDGDFARRVRGRASDRGDRADRRGRRLRGRDRDYDERDDRRGRNSDRNDRNDRADRNDRTERNVEREQRHEEPKEDLVPVAGIVDVLDSYAFVRTSGYLPGPNDVYVSMGQVKKYGLRKGDAVHGSIRTPREGDRRNQRQKFVPLQSIDSINGMTVEAAQNRPQFNKLTPLYPQERLKQETAPSKLTGRLIDIVAPIGKGQRGLIVSPPKAGKTITLQNIANAIATNNPEVHLMVVLVDERPEEVTDMERTVQGEVISSTFDRPASDHTTVAELAIERAKRLVELGQDVVVLLDSMTRLARAYNIAAPASGRILSGGVDAQALYPPKKFFGAARNIENGGSLTIISSALVETGSKMDEVIFEEFKGTGNMELRLSRELADKRLFPAIDVNASGTRREELITDPQELPIIYRLRRLLGGLEPEQAYQTLVPRLKKTATNRDFMASLIQQSSNNANNGSN
ncbi:transcription termination factor Rho [Bifidobacterium catenulatum subsp. kashiwanohense]|uniref:transcription termination factor Rho n=1 Tax=Bifidobacterium catenulatum TaxID=1686 RepID=UPI0005297A2B|nr:transcription termination factor Rho [Bifidobacterium catenulatum]MDH7871992.1 transcription termination factor Rho [Bifidobacterium catenulatum subsp. kashiwanohense]MDH7883347.1 transcription termination factor Rho [Bifidobacterium catenulatum subsp. kashiwanohense]QGM63378.1 transcription termination factor Rho [Bifidobacterium catenulatum subsp. kashiwanohense]BAQ29830.1 transcription termination factor Rho [Bifidobacterium catenulatum subsp. kashiwanohense JCM 15439 = DSM 21854]